MSSQRNLSQIARLIATSRRRTSLCLFVCVSVFVCVSKHKRIFATQEPQTRSASRLECTFCSQTSHRFVFARLSRPPLT